MIASNRDSWPQFSSTLRQFAGSMPIKLFVFNNHLMCETEMSFSRTCLIIPNKWYPKGFKSGENFGLGGNPFLTSDGIIERFCFMCLYIVILWPILIVFQSKHDSNWSFVVESDLWEMASPVFRTFLYFSSPGTIRCNADFLSYFDFPFVITIRNYFIICFWLKMSSPCNIVCRLIFSKNFDGLSRSSFLTFKIGIS